MILSTRNNLNFGYIIGYINKIIKYETRKII
jgi:hypothetical protein